MKTDLATIYIDKQGVGNMSHKNNQNSPFFIFIFISLLAVNGCSQLNSVITPAFTPAATPSIPPTIAVTPTLSLQDIAGLVYKLNNELWLIDKNGTPQFLFNLPQDAFTFDIQLSGDVAEILYEHDGDIWIANLETQEQRNLTNTSDRIEKSPQFWKGRSEVAILESLPLTEFSSLNLPGTQGAPTTVNLDGNDYQILDENGRSAFLFSSNGKKMIYQLPKGLIAIYGWETAKTEIIDTNFYELPSSREEEILIEAWSPDERYLAGWIKGYLNYGEKYQFGIGIIDLKAKTSLSAHLISLRAGTEIPPYLSWSPNGEWLVFTMAADPAYPGEFISLWLSQTNTRKEIHIGEGVNPIWYEDGKRLAYDRKAKALIDGIWIFDLENYMQHKTPLPDKAILIDWVSLNP